MSVSTVMATSIFDSNSGFPFCRVSSAAISSARCASSSPARWSMAPRFRAARPCHASPSKQLRAAVTAASTSAGPAWWTWARTSSVAGFTTANVWPDVAGRHSLPMNSSVRTVTRP